MFCKVLNCRWMSCIYWHIVEYVPWILNWNLVADNNITLRGPNHPITSFNILWARKYVLFFHDTQIEEIKEDENVLSPYLSLQYGSNIINCTNRLHDKLTMYFNYYSICPCSVVTLPCIFFSFFNNLGWPYHLNPMRAWRKCISYLIDLNYLSLG